MKSLLEVIAKALVDHPDSVVIEEVAQGRNKTYRLSVHSDDMGKVIGKQGRIARALRTVVGAKALKENERVTIEIR
ncbi:KH domain-containing protein [Aneurinibacillus uraniidurans]|uniref:KH domain-containing protein n=1 Tax=Aneurinibacillus uraniidurans TaxID=2966586 RepID=UPI00234BCF13|nr:KH domain-containing protein [Aneurinibacillus sp. B1]WCN39066.1 KH domain-containing protein [Aneurinibacillus sp. B1]